MFKSSYKIAALFGIPIKVHISLLLLVILIVSRFGPLAGLGVGLGLLVSIVLHELGHSLVALRKGCKVREITLLCVGGAAQIERIPTRPLDEFLMAVAGPLVSFALGVGGVLLGAALPGLPPVRELPPNIVLLLWSFPNNIIVLLGMINLVLVFFNLLPSFPMDGGRVLRAVLSPRLGRLKATLIASRIGKVMAVFFGVQGFFAQYWMLVFIAFFIYISAGNEYRIVAIEEAMKQRGRPARAGFEEVAPTDPTDDRVVVGPPPYDGDTGYTTKIRSAEREP